jgi:hypothetical protein
MKNFNPVFLCGHRKSGTSMFLNLFDGNKDINVFPTDLHLLYAYYPMVEKSLNNVQKRERLENILFKEFSKIKILKESIDLKKYNELFFQDVKKNYSTKNLIYNLLNIYNQNFTSKKTKSIICKETSIEIYATEIKRWFKNAKFIHLIRDPRDNYSAIKSGLEKYYSKFNDDRLSILFSIIFRYLNGLEAIEYNKKIIGKDYYVCRFEDLILSPKKEMKKLCEFLNINFSEDLLTPTVLGSQTYGNNFGKLKLKEISKINIGNWSKRIDNEEAAILEHYFEKFMKKYKYKLNFEKDFKHKSVVEFYKLINHKYFFYDRFS